MNFVIKDLLNALQIASDDLETFTDAVRCLQSLHEKFIIEENHRALQITTDFLILLRDSVDEAFGPK